MRTHLKVPGKWLEACGHGNVDRVFSVLQIEEGKVNGNPVTFAQVDRDGTPWMVHVEMRGAEFVSAPDITWLATPPAPLSASEQSVIDRCRMLQRLAAFATGHGHAVEIDYMNDCIRVGIQWINSTQGTRGTEWTSVSDLASLRDLLGY